MSGKATTIKGVKVAIGADTTELGDAIKKAKSTASGLKTELSGVETLLKFDPTNTVLLTQKQDILAESISAAKDKLKMLGDAQEEVGRLFEYGDIGADQYRDFEREIESTRQQLTRLEAAASGTDGAVADVGDAAEEAGEKAQKASGGWTVLKGVMADLASSAIKAAVSTVVDGAKKMASAGLEYNQAMEGYVTNFTTMLGGSSEAANGMVGSLQKLASATPLAMSDLAGGAQTLLAFGVASDDVSGTLQRLGDISLGNADKMQSLARAYGKATAQGKLTGETVQMMIDAGWNPLIDICDQTGESMEDVQKRMAAGSISAEELTQAVKHATDAGGKFAGGMEAASKTVAGLTSTLQDNVNALLGELMQPVSDAMLSTLLPTAIDAIDQLMTAFEDEGIDGFSRVAGSLIASLSAQLVSYAPQAIPAALAFIGALVTGLLSALPDLTGTAIELVGALLLGIADQLPGIITAAMSALLGIVGKITSPESITLLIQAAMQLMLALARGLIAAIPQLIDAVPGIITNLVESFYAMLPEIIGVGIEIVIALASGLVSNSGHIIAAVPRLVETIVRGFLANVKSYWDIGKSIVDGIREGITEQWQRLKSDVSNLFTGLVSWIKNLLGIHSPSRVFADIGQNMAAGIGDGWASTIGDINRQIGESLQPQYVIGVDMQGLYAQAAALQAAAAPGAGGDIAALLERLDRLERAITGMQIYMDGDALVGSVATRMDYALGGIYTSKARRTI